MTVQITRRLFTVYDYARMRETGILGEDDRVELLDGEVREMSPIGPVHIAIVNRLTRILAQQIGDSGILSIQNPIRLNDYTEPQPDISILRPRDDFYSNSLPIPDDILLVIEVSDTTIAYDRNEKLPRYAEAKIPEAWIIDIAQQRIEQYTTPVQGQYTQISMILFGQPITSQSISAIRFTTDSILS